MCASCDLCGNEAKFSIQVVMSGGRFYLPNQYVTREKLSELALCHNCIRRIEDAFRGVISLIQIEASGSNVDPATGASGLS